FASDSGTAPERPAPLRSDAVRREPGRFGAEEKRRRVFEHARPATSDVAGRQKKRTRAASRSRRPRIQLLHLKVPGVTAPVCEVSLQSSRKLILTSISFLKLGQFKYDERVQLRRDLRGSLRL